MDFTDDIEKYVLNYSDAEDPVLYELSRETNLKVLNPRMLSGKIQGKLLEFISKIIQPKNILEIGTYTGYSSICLAKGLPVDGKLYTIEINDEIESISKKYFKKAGLNHKIIQHLGDALEILPQLQICFDLVFIDGDKKEYINYYNLVIDKVRPGGIIIVDNVLWNGKVLEEKSTDHQTVGVKNFNCLVKKDQRIEKVILPLRDGLTLIRKKNSY